MIQILLCTLGITKHTLRYVCTKMMWKQSDTFIMLEITKKVSIYLFICICKEIKQKLTVRHLKDKINLFHIKISDKSNIIYDLGNKGLHLNGRNTGRLAMNIISLIKQLHQFKETTFSISNFILRPMKMFLNPQAKMFIPQTCVAGLR